MTFPKSTFSSKNLKDRPWALRGNDDFWNLETEPLWLYSSKKAAVRIFCYFFYEILELLGVFLHFVWIPFSTSPFPI